MARRSSRISKRSTTATLHLGEADHTQVTEQFAAHIACVSEQEVIPGREYQLKLAGQELAASVTGVKYRLDIDNLHRVPARTLARGDIGVCTVATHTPAGDRWLRRLPACGTLHAVRPFHRRERSPPAPWISPSAAA